MRSSRIVVAFFVSALFCIGAACGGTTTPEEPALLGPDASATDVCTELAQIKCAKRDTCTAGSDNARDFGDMSTCITREALGCSFGIPSTDPSSFVTKNESCVSQIQGLSCTDFLQNNYGAPCQGPGSGEAGAGCVFNTNCASGFCTNNRFAVCGSCGEPPAAGSSCATTNCGPNAGCFWNANLVNICEPDVPLGGACGQDSTPGCASDLTCQLTSGLLTGTCANAVQSVGATCGSANNGIGCDNTHGLTCTTIDKIKSCTAIKFLSDGATCGTQPDGSYAECAAGQCWTPDGPFTSTAYPTGICKAFAVDGAGCDTVLGPTCMNPARCVTGDAGSTGVCTLLTHALRAACD